MKFPYEQPISRPKADPSAPLFLDKNERCERLSPWAHAALRDLPLESVWQYPDRGPLEEKLARKFSVTTDQIWVTAGSDQAIRALFSQLHPETTIVLPQPIFIVFPTVAKQLGFRCIEVPHKDDFRVDLKSLKEAITGLREAMLVLTRPNNPTGEVIPREVILDILGTCRQEDVWVLLDEAYVEFSGDSLVDSLPNCPNLLIIRTFSKAFGLAGLRVGCLLGHASMIGPIKENALPYEVATTSLFMAERALEEDATADAEAYCRQVAKNRDRIQNDLRSWGIEVFDSYANFLFLRMHPRRANFVASLLRNRGIHIRHFRRSSLEGCLRFSIPANMDRLRKALAEAFSPQLICLDVDGTIINTRPSFDEVIRILVNRWTGKSVPTEEIDKKRAQGGFNDDYVLAHALIADSSVHASVEEIASQGTELYLGDGANPGLCARETKLIHRKTYQKICDRAHVALVTGRSREELGPALELLDLESELLAITTDDVAEKKPHPEGILLAAKHFNATRIWMVGDNADDISAAHAAGAVPIAVGPNANVLHEIGAFAALEEINQIEELL